MVPRAQNNMKLVVIYSTFTFHPLCNILKANNLIRGKKNVDKLYLVICTDYWLFLPTHWAD